jgi:hypothetical protein
VRNQAIVNRPYFRRRYSKNSAPLRSAPTVEADTRSNRDAPKSNLGCRPRYVNRRVGPGYLRAGGPTPAALRRNQSTLRAGGICAGRCQNRRRFVCGLHRADHTANAATASGEQAFATDCKAQNPNFGQRNATPSQAAQPPGQVSPLPRAAPQQRNAPSSQTVEPPASPTNPAASPPQPAPE